MVYVLDASGFIYRAYYTSKMSGPNLEPAGALFGFCSMMIRLLNVLPPETKLLCVFDSGGKNFRHEIYQAYKANRPNMPEELIPQCQWIKELCDAFGIQRCEMEGYEADDIIASYARFFVDVTIISADKDLMQLISDRVKFLDPQTYLEKTREDVFKKFGIYPEKIVDFLSLTGDASDNIPGVPGIGPKGAAELLTLFDSLDGIYSNIDRIEQKKKKETLLSNKDLAFLSKRLVQLKDNLNCTPVDVLQCNPQQREEFLMKWGFKSLISRLKHNQ